MIAAGFANGKRGSLMWGIAGPREQPSLGGRAGSKSSMGVEVEAVSIRILSLAKGCRFACRKGMTRARPEWRRNVLAQLLCNALVLCAPGAKELGSALPSKKRSLRL